MLAECERCIDKDEAADPIGMQARCDRRERPADRMAGEDRRRRFGFGHHDIDRGPRQAVGVIGKAVGALRLAWNEPLEEIHSQAARPAMAYHAHVRQKVPDVGPLEGRRDDQDGRARDTLLLIGAQPSARKLRGDAVRHLPRAEAHGVEPASDLPPNFVRPTRHAICSTDLMQKTLLWCGDKRQDGG
jgi:hypothetical protein